MITEIPCIAYFAGDRDTVVTTDESPTGLGKILWQKQNDNVNQPIELASRYLNVAEQNYLIG